MPKKIELKFSEEDLSIPTWQLTDKLYASEKLIGNELKRQGLSKKHPYQTLVIPKEEIYEKSMNQLSREYGYSLPTILKSIEYCYGINRYEITAHKKKRRMEEINILYTLSDEELRKSRRYIEKVHKIPYKYLKTERDKRGIVIEHVPDRTWMKFIWGRKSGERNES